MNSHALTFFLRAFIAAGWTTPVIATADGPDHFAVSGVAQDEVLGLRVVPSAQAVKIGEIAHDGQGLRNLGCQGSPSCGEWERMSEQQRWDGRKNFWCKVRYQRLEGWVAGRFLREDGD